MKFTQCGALRATPYTPSFSGALRATPHTPRLQRRATRDCHKSALRAIVNLYVRQVRYAVTEGIHTRFAHISCTFCEVSRTIRTIFRMDSRQIHAGFALFRPRRLALCDASKASKATFTSSPQVTTTSQSDFIYLDMFKRYVLIRFLGDFAL